MRIPKTLRTLLGLSLLCGAVLSVRADDIVTFQVDMSSFTNSAGAQMATNVTASGAFNGWSTGASPTTTLINNGANVYTNTFIVAGAPATDVQYKFTYTTWAGTTWEDNNPPPGPNAGNNRVLTLVGGAQTLPLVPFYAPSVSLPLADPPTAPVNPVFFQVDMTGFTNGSGGPAYSQVNVSGDFNNWGQTALALSTGNIYTNTLDLFSKTPGSATSWKFTFTAPNGINWEDNNSESPTENNRSFIVVGGPAVQTLPLIPFYAPSILLPLDFVTNNITFQVDMRVQGATWINGGGLIRVAGAFSCDNPLYGGWGDGLTLTNDPGAPFPTNWFYSGTFAAKTQLIPPGGTPAQKINRYKFRANGGWEEPSTINAAGNNDRWWDATTTGDRVLPLVLYSDASLCDTLEQDTTVTFILHITNGTQTITGHAFDNTVDTIHINGESLLGSWQNWNSLFCPQLVNNPVGSDFYEYTQVIPAGRPRNQKVKYGIDYVGNPGNIDNEAPGGQDHIQWIRTTNTTYVMAPVEFGTNYASIRVQPQFGNLKVSAPSAGTIPVTWDGCACVTLQQRSSLTSGSWIDLPETDATSSTNMPVTGDQKFFRLQKRATP
jgi:hypothetical protein